MKTNKLLTLGLVGTSLMTSGCAHSAGVRPASDQASVPSIYAFESDASGFNTKTFFYDNGEEVVAFDTQFTPELAKQAIAFLRAHSSHPITYAVVTHPNPDKFNGMSVFQAEGAKVVMSDKTLAALPGVQAYKQAYFVGAKLFTDDTYPKLGKPDVVFHETMDLALASGEKIALTELSEPGVSSNQTVAFIPGANALMVGDLVHHKVHAWLEGGIVNGKPTPTLGGWISDLKEIISRFGGSKEIVVYGGRGEAVDLQSAVPEQIAYLQKADRLVSAYVQTLHGANPDFTDLQKQFEAAFPNYGLDYMIAYGVYGLVASHQLN